MRTLIIAADYLMTEPMPSASLDEIESIGIHTEMNPPAPTMPERKKRLSSAALPFKLGAL